MTGTLEYDENDGTHWRTVFEIHEQGDFRYVSVSKVLQELY